MKRGEVYYISRGEPQTDSEIFSGRPAVIVSDDHLNSTSKVIEVVYLTTQTKKPMPTHAAITSSMQESTVLCEQIASVAVSRVGDYMCTLSETEMEAVNQALMASLGLQGMCANQKTDESEEITRLKIERDTYEKLVNKLFEKVRFMI